MHGTGRRVYQDGLLASVYLIVALLASACSGKAAPPELTMPPDVTTTPPLQQRTFEEIWSTVDENYVYDDFHGVDWQAVHDRYLDKVEAGSSADEFAETMHAMLAELPPDAAIWQTRTERIEQDTEDTSTYEGIGAYVAIRGLPEPRVLLLSVLPESPAGRAGLDAHDSILAVDGVPVRAEEGLDVVERIRGPAGSEVRLRVRSPGESPKEVVVTRGRLVAADQLKLSLIYEGRIGYLLFPPAAYDGLDNDVLASLQALTSERELEGLILDLRIAAPGAGWPIEFMLTLFADGELGESYTRTETETIVIEGDDIAQDLPVAIIVGPDTKGFPEVFAAAMQATGRATVVGMPTPGAVEGMSEFPMPDGSRVFVATSSYRAPDGRDIGLDGVEPDVEVRTDWDAVTFEDDRVRDAATEALTSSGG